MVLKKDIGIDKDMLELLLPNILLNLAQVQYI